MVLEPEGLLRQLSPSLLDRRTALQAAAKGEHLQFLKTVGGEPCWETGCGRKMVSLGEKVLESQLPVGSPRLSPCPLGAWVSYQDGVRTGVQEGICGIC